MSGSFYVGPNPSDLIFDGLGERFFYGLRRTDDGELFLAKIDQLGSDSLIINKSGDPVKNYPDFEEGNEFFDGRDINHNLVYENLNYEQFRWDDANLVYYINNEGELVVRVNQDADAGTITYADTTEDEGSGVSTGWDETGYTCDNNSLTYDKT